MKPVRVEVFCVHVDGIEVVWDDEVRGETDLSSRLLDEYGGSLEDYLEDHPEDAERPVRELYDNPSDWDALMTAAMQSVARQSRGHMRGPAGKTLHTFGEARENGVNYFSHLLTCSCGRNERIRGDALGRLIGQAARIDGDRRLTTHNGFYVAAIRDAETSGTE